MKNRLLIIQFFFICSINIFSQQLRESIVVVRPVFHESTTEFLKRFSESLKKDGYTMTSEYLKNYSEGNGFGSGFIIKGDDGKAYVLTNRHIVMQAESATIEFFNPDGSKTNYSNCKIEMIDDNNDLALLSFPDGVVIKGGLNLRLLPVNDGSDVFSAGFPGMKGKPSWQLGKGIISNSVFPMKTLDDEMNFNVIQHTAQIDRGSSGSPLLIADANEASGYSVVGLNTWKVFNRENVNLAIPIPIIKKFVTKAISAGKIDNNQALEIQSRQFVSDALLGYKKVLKYVSHSYISKISVEKFYYFWNNATKDAQKEIATAFENDQPIEAVRIAIADAIAQSVGEDKYPFTFVGVSGVASYNSPTNVSLLLKSQPVTSSWIIEQNSWKLETISCLKVKKSKTYDVGNNFSYSSKVIPQLYISANDAEKNGYGIEYTVGDRFFYGLAWYKFFHLATDKESSSDAETNVSNKTEYVKYSELTINLGYQYPFRISRIYLVPFIKGSLGFYTGDIKSFANRISYGLQTAYHLKNDHFVVLQFEIAPHKIVMGDFSENNSDYNTILYTDTKLSGFNIGIGYTF